MITVATWNVLHRVHAENWCAATVEHRPDESRRIAAITARLARRGEQAIALQEVSGDQLADLRDALPKHSVHVLRYPRTPEPRRGETSLRDPREHLVLIVDGPAEQCAAEAFPDDPGKGLLAVRTGGVLVVATHLSYDRRRPAQLARLRDVAAGSAEPAVLLGDFNTDRSAVADGLGPGFTVAEHPPGMPPTRPGGPGEESRDIDHVVVRGGSVESLVVEDAEGLSDHNLVCARVRT
ncbi:MAG TPA: endonuclease/exonuclease/phosphatase family protein [Yinghuangia sp.]|uniref:endonuclease/exonuclease/phosphatase family protein n=1 Tax=Yinghuangia sp. YIM S10712 TaxID=3436930 RepID=UPI002CB4F6D9|nr:endonuclease/exonuclease/phosphatase family protein [Yinghuangia sp.]